MHLPALIAASLLLPVEPTAYLEITFEGGGTREIPVEAKAVASTAAAIGTFAGDPLPLPKATAPLPVRGSAFSPLSRARDLFDTTAWPARAVAKLYRLRVDGARSETACTAQFVGARHLVTAGHCIVDRTTGQPHPGFEIAIGHDRGVDRQVVKVARAWIPTAQRRVAPGSGELITPERCGDLALIEVAEPVGSATGWLGMRDAPPGPEQVLHRFSYPHQSAVVTLKAQLAKPGFPEQARAAVLREIAKRGAAEPDFSPDNLYYEYGRADEAKGRYIADRTGYALPGRSGSALIDADSAIVGLFSRSYDGAGYSCRLTGPEIGELTAIMRRS